MKRLIKRKYYKMVSCILWFIANKFVWRWDKGFQRLFGVASRYRSLYWDLVFDEIWEES